MTDRIADFIIRLKNAYLARHDEIIVPATRVLEAMAKKLVEHGYIVSVERISKTPQDDLKIVLRYVDGVAAITHVRRISKPGRRVYQPVKAVGRVMGGHGLILISTPLGILNDKEVRAQNVAGEVLCEVW